MSAISGTGPAAPLDPIDPSDADDGAQVASTDAATDTAPASATATDAPSRRAAR